MRKAGAARGQRVAVHAGQADVEQRQLRAVLLGQQQPLFGLEGDVHLVALQRQRLGQQFDTVLVVVHQQHAPAVLPRGIGQQRAARRLYRLLAQRHAHHEAAALAGAVAVRLDLAFVHAHQAFDQRKASTSPPATQSDACRCTW